MSLDHSRVRADAESEIPSRRQKPATAPIGAIQRPEPRGRGLGAGVGNRTMVRLIQHKLTVGPAGDRYEHEADRVAKKVVGALAAGRTSAGPTAPAQRQEEEELMMSRVQRQEEEELMMSRVQRQEEEEEELQPSRVQRQEEEELMMSRVQRQEEEEEELQPSRVQRQEEEELMMSRVQRQEEEEELMMSRVQRQEEEEEEIQPSRVQRQEEEELMMSRVQRQEEEEELMMSRVQRQEEEELMMSRETIDPVVGLEGGGLDRGTESAIQAARGKGRPLEEGVRAEMEGAFGADFSGVRIHSGGDADHLNRSMQAKAFTTGTDIFFRRGGYDPSDRQKRETLADELTHVVQQRGQEPAV